MVAGDVGLEISDNTGGAVFYYNHNLGYPNWADAMQTIGILGNHTFLK
jgi:spore germination cell wall hydrolase CwlJ-like protein